MLCVALPGQAQSKGPHHIHAHAADYGSAPCGSRHAVAVKSTTFEQPSSPALRKDPPTDIKQTGIGTYKDHSVSGLVLLENGTTIGKAGRRAIVKLGATSSQRLRSYWRPRKRLKVI